MRRIVFFILLVALINCSDEKEPGPRPFARVNTLAVAEISSEGALLSGEIALAGHSIIDHGFVMSRFAQFPSTGSAKYSLGAVNSVGNFQIRAETDLEEGVKYYVKAFAKTADFTSFGLPVEFVSLGSKAPQLKTLSHAKGIWKDLVVLKGENFSSIKANNVVKFAGHLATIASCSPDSIACYVPESLNVSPATVQVSVHGNSSQLTGAFTLLPPEIDTVDPAQGDISKSITITGRNFNWNTTRVTVGDVPVQQTNNTSTSIVFKVPPGTVSGPTKIKVITAEGNGSAEADFIVIAPAIANVFPLTGTYGDIITVEVENWLQDQQAYLVFGPYEISPQTQTANSMTFRIPESTETYQYEIQIRLGSSIIQSGKVFTLDPPEIYAVEPELALSTQLTITGKGFSTFHIDVQVDNYSADIYQSQHETIWVGLPQSEVHLASVKVTSSGRTVEAPNKIRIPFARLSNNGPSSWHLYNMFAIGDLLYVTAGTSWDNYLYMFDRSNSNWVVLEHLPFMASDHDYSFTIGQTGYYYSSSTKSFWAYSAATGITQKNDPPFDLTRPATYSVNQNGYVVGGYDEAWNLTNEVWRYDPSLDVWSKQSSAGEALIERIGFVKDNICYAFHTDGRLAAYDPQNDKWTMTSHVFDITQRFVGFNKGSLYFRSHSSELTRYFLETGTYSHFEDQGLLDNVLSETYYQTDDNIYFLNNSGQFWEFDGSYL